ncbi:MAG: 4-(cytidine 5'-diphospho)-2-C-methyl-D-erythritol kinase [Gammaproteobacteria bacterium]|nr:MAG: 4-(cytidine 5'-diphospho)-2-C-methyl-D-erythritol kinase [Gammaproteobacteria bacterium]
MISWPAPAKINLFLHITGQRKDGYHQLQTVFQFLDYCDHLQFQITDQSEIRLLTSIAGVDDADNLIVRAAKLLQQHADVKYGVEITLDKQLPMGGGLGGGSSNAATTLVALNTLWQCQLSNDELARLGLILGADVPVFIHGHAAWAEGVGEKLTSVSPPEPWYVVIVPSCHVSTSEIFSDPELTRDCEHITISRFLSGEGRNICEDVVTKNYPLVADALDWLSQYAKPRMSGTGACVFADFQSQYLAQQVMTNLPEAWQGFVAKGCNQSPLTALVSSKKEAMT